MHVVFCLQLLSSSTDEHLQKRSSMLSKTASGGALAASTAVWQTMQSRPPPSVTACRYSTTSLNLRRSTENQEQDSLSSHLQQVLLGGWGQSDAQNSVGVTQGAWGRQIQDPEAGPGSKRR